MILIFEAIMKKIITLPLLLLCSHAFAQSLPVGKYSDAGMSNGYKSGVVFSFSGDVPNDLGTPVTISLKSEVKPSVLARFKGKTLLKVVQTGTLTVADEVSNFQEISYIDPTSLKELYTVNAEDGEISTIEHIQDHPEIMEVGDVIPYTKDTRVSEKNPGVTISYTESFLSLMPLEGKKGLFEFCNNSGIYKSADNFKAIQESYNFCVILDKDGKNLGAFVDITAAGISARLSGSIKQK
jgi:hypothetical protein